MSKNKEATSDLNKDDNFEKAFKIAKTFRKLGENNSTFSSWKNDIVELFEHYSLNEYEKKIIIKATVSMEYYDTCNDVCYANKDKDASTIMNEIKKQLGYGNTSTNNLNELEKICVKNNNVRQYNINFKKLLNGIENSDKPSQSRLVHYYIRGLYGTRYYNTMVLKDCDTVENAIKEVDKMVDSFEKFGDNNRYHKQNNHKQNNKNFNKNNNSQAFYSNYNNKKINNNQYKETNHNKPKSNTEESDVENITKQFAKMNLHLCHRCGNPGHIARFCTNELSPENLKYDFIPSIKFSSFLLLSILPLLS